MTTRICFLSLTHSPFDTRVFHKEARSLADAGFDVIHIAPGTEVSRRECGVYLEGYPQSEGFVGRLIKFLRLYHRAVKADADCYHCNEIESWIVGCLIKLFDRKKHILFDVHEHYPSRFQDPRFPRFLAGVGELLIRGLFRVLTPWTDYLIFAKHSVAKDFSGIEGKHAFVYNYGLLRLQSRQLGDVGLSVREQFTGHQTAVHIGELSRIRGWPQMLEALALMKQELRVLCLGEIEEGEEALLTEVRRLGLSDRVLVRRRVPLAEMFDYLLCADIGLMLYQPGILNHVYAFPMKLYDYMSAGLPVIGPDFAIEVTPVVQEAQCGILVDTASPAQIADALDWLCANPLEAKEMGRRGREAIIKKYNWESEAKKLIDIYLGFDAELTHTRKVNDE